MTALRIFVFAAVLAPAFPAFGQSWELVQEDEGIKVWQRPIPGTSLVEFRGKGEVPHNIRRVLAVLADHDRKPEWMHGCVENKLVQAFTPKRLVVYNRTGVPYPFISDRDVVAETDVQFWPEKKQIRIDAWNVENKHMPEVDGVVRMPKLILSWVLVKKSEKTTEVTYQVQADPGGSIPKWLVNMASKKIPFNSIRNLRRQAGKDYEREVAQVEASFDWARVGM